MAIEPKIVELAPRDAPVMRKLLVEATDEYLKFAINFRSRADSLVHSIKKRSEDRWWGFKEGEQLIGFFMLRGFDEGYQRPAFGVFISEAHTGRGLARHAINHALDWCQTAGVKSIMLRVDPNHGRATAIYLQAGFRPTGWCSLTGQQIMEKNLEPVGGRDFSHQG